MITGTLGLMVVFYLAFMIIPIIYAFVGSFCNWNPMIGQMDFVGLENYKTMLGSTAFQKALVNTLVFTVVVTLFRVVLGMLLAVLIDSLGFLKSFFERFISFRWLHPWLLFPWCGYGSLSRPAELRIRYWAFSGSRDWAGSRTSILLCPRL